MEEDKEHQKQMIIKKKETKKIKMMEQIENDEKDETRKFVITKTDDRTRR